MIVVVAFCFLLFVLFAWGEFVCSWCFECSCWWDGFRGARWCLCGYLVLSVFVGCLRGVFVVVGECLYHGWHGWGFVV